MPVNDQDNRSCFIFTGFKPKKIWLTQRELDAMDEYSSSTPSLTTIGKMWKRHYQHAHSGFVVCEFIDHRGGNPDLVSVETYDVIIVK